ncbi:SKP1-like protein 7 isoform X1 [Salvia hispanica]|uniref:SKP1-like protein 7 isoform X1 n=1 Tax=Salvia hispanica TaxID=49212 RepID=UPI002009957A|nr:SKP1-like protein 7 isoform X1 [Salvia hispanica]
MENREKVTSLRSSDGHIFPVEDTVIAEFRSIHSFLPAAGDAVFPISQITGDILAKVIDYCRKHIDHKLNRLRDEEITAWDRHFVNVDEKTLLDLLVASHFLGVKDLFSLIMVSVADMTKKKGVGSMDQLHNLFISNFRLD